MGCETGLSGRRPVSHSGYTVAMHPGFRFVPAALLLAVCVAAGEPRVEIHGGADPSEQNYKWTVVNQSGQPIVSVSFPHYNGDLFLPPSGWESAATALRGPGSKPEPGICRGYVDQATQSGILPNSSAEFSLRISRDGAMKGHGPVEVRFKDGSTLTVANVELPVAPSFFGRFGYMIALAAAFAIFLVVQVVRRRKNGAPPDDSAGQEPA